MKPLLRLDAATVLKRFFHLERAFTVGCAAWIPHVAGLDGKAALARAAWESSLAAAELRRRVFELRYPDRSMDPAGDEPLIALFESIPRARSPFSAMMSISALAAALEEAYRTYLAYADELADGPTHRFMRLAIVEKAHQREDVTSAAIDGAERDEPAAGELYDRLRTSVEAWLLDPFGSVAGIDAPPSGDPVAIPDRAARDRRYFACSFYWPDNFDPGYAYGEGTALQVRTAVSHINEVWATDTAAAILYGYADALGWDFIADASRWLYDESRHMTMGRRRFESWGVPAEEVPLGSYIYEASAGEGPLVRLGMLAYFETKNINNKVRRAEEFGRMGDVDGQRDMEFDWADEAIHAGYGRRWLRRALDAEGRSGEEWPQVVRHCEELVGARVAAATEGEKEALYRQAERLRAICEERLAT